MNLTYQETDFTLFMLWCNYFNVSILSIILQSHLLSGVLSLYPVCSPYDVMPVLDVLDPWV